MSVGTMPDVTPEQGTANAQGVTIEQTERKAYLAHLWYDYELLWIGLIGVGLAGVLFVSLVAYAKGKGVLPSA